jgi:hypothetical protein
MPRIVLTEEQARVLAESKGRVEVYDAQGRLMCFMDWLGKPLEEIIAECKRRRASGERGIPGARVQAMLRRFEEIDRTEGMTREKMEEILRRVKAGEEI